MATKILRFSILAAPVLAAPVRLPITGRGNLPPRISVSTAKTYLSELALANEVNNPAYDREYFNTCIPISGNCDTREYVLKRDGSSVGTSTACEATSGSWFSDYDGATWASASDVDIDHVVLLVSMFARHYHVVLTRT